ncbi:MAG: glycosyltransferase family 2 protein [Burkholderiales bacterium]|nr:glycosyltransferase family 2 protein [Burkholderiales bacterium]
MILEQAIVVAQWVFFAYLVGLNTGFLLLNVSAFFAVRRYLTDRVLEDLLPIVSGMEPPVSVIVPAYNEENTIATSVRSMLQLEYPEFEIVVVNDGSRDGTLEALRREFALIPFPEAYRRRLPVRPVRGIYRSLRHANLRVIDKENGGKADALNAGINAARYPLVCAVDADSILERRSLRRVVAPFLHDPRMIATGGTVRVANGCVVRGGFLEEVALPRRLLPLFQVVEYLRAFLFGRAGWSPAKRGAHRLRRVRRLPPGSRRRGGRLPHRHRGRGHGTRRAPAPPSPARRSERTGSHSYRNRSAGPRRRSRSGCCAPSALAGSAASPRA